MRLDLGQTAERLNVSKETVKRLEAAGRLTNLRPVKEGATKRYRLYESKQVNALKLEGSLAPKRGYTKPNGSLPGSGAFTPQGKSDIVPANGILTRLARLEEKIDQLIALWN